MFCLNGLREESFITSVYVRDSMPDFDQLVALMVTEEMNLQGSTSSSNQSQVFYVGNRGRGRYNRSRGRGRSFPPQIQEQSQQNQSNENIRGRRGASTYTQRGRYGARKGSITCYVCGKQGHYAHQCYHRSQGNNNYASTSKNQDNSENLLVMNHVSSNNDKNIDHNWYIDSGCSNHMSYNKCLRICMFQMCLVMYKLRMILGIVLNWLGKYRYKIRVVLQIS